MLHPRSTATQWRDADPEGILYYVRLKSQFGMLYKLGFTSLASVHERLAYQGRGHEKLIDAVLFSARFDNALVLEQCLHKHFKNKALFPMPERDMPLFDNGQSEVYAEDILGLDRTYTEVRAKAVVSAIHTYRLRQLGKTESEITKLAIEDAARDQLIRDLDASIGWAFRLYKRLCHWLQGRQKVEPRAVEEKKVLEVNDVLALIKEIAQHYERTETEIRAAIAALKAKDAEAFGRLVSIGQFSYNLISELNRLYCWLEVDQFNGWKPRITETGFDTATLWKISEFEGMFEPVRRTYENLLIEYVKNHTVVSDEIFLPSDRIKGHEVLNEHFRPGIFLDILGRQWTFPDVPTFTRDKWLGTVRTGGGRTDFPITVRNEQTDVTTTIVIRCLVQQGKLCINFLDIREILLSLDARVAAGSASPRDDLQSEAAA